MPHDSRLGTMEYPPPQMLLFPPGALGIITSGSGDDFTPHLQNQLIINAPRDYPNYDEGFTMRSSLTPMPTAGGLFQVIPPPWPVAPSGTAPYSSELNTITPCYTMPSLPMGEIVSSHPSRMFPPFQQWYQSSSHSNLKDIGCIPSNAPPGLCPPIGTQDDCPSTPFTLPPRNQPSGVNALRNRPSRKKLTKDSSPIPRKCNLCRQMFPGITVLNRHFKQAHMRENMYPCSMCDMTFGKGGCLNKHFTVHTKPYKCDCCDVVFARKSSLTAHTCEKKKSRCRYCKQAFTQGFSLNKHERKCTEKELYSTGYINVFNAQGDNNDDQDLTRVAQNDDDDDLTKAGPASMSMNFYGSKRTKTRCLSCYSRHARCDMVKPKCDSKWPMYPLQNRRVVPLLTPD